jgi:hypothetical protein
MSHPELCGRLKRNLLSDYRGVSTDSARRFLLWMMRWTCVERTPRRRWRGRVRAIFERIQDPDAETTRQRLLALACSP